MADIDAMFDGLEHPEVVQDTGPYFEIDPVTRNIYTSAQNVTLVQYDHNSERFTFCLPRYIENHDMLNCDKAEVHYTTKSGKPDVYEMRDVLLCKDDDSKITCTWLVSQNATVDIGALSFSLRFSCLDDDCNVEYAWHTCVFTGVNIVRGMHNTPAVAELYADVIEQLKRDIVSIASIKSNRYDEGFTRVTITMTNGSVLYFDVFDGHTPEKGVDYWTEEDKAEIKGYVDEVVVGSIGQAIEEIIKIQEEFIEKSKVTIYFLDANNVLLPVKLDSGTTWAEAIETDELKAIGQGFAIGDDGYVRCYVINYIKKADYEGDVSVSTFPTWCIKGTDKVKDGQVYTASDVYEFNVQG